MFRKLIWFTGLSGTGKSTLSKILNKSLKDKGFKTKIIDGDRFRKKTKIKQSFSKMNIIKNNLNIITEIQKFKDRFQYILVATISPLKKIRSSVKKKFGKSYIEVFIKTSLETLIKRDTKGLYKQAKNGKIKNLIGYNSPIIYEKSKYKILEINTEKLSIEKSINVLLKQALKN